MLGNIDAIELGAISREAVRIALEPSVIKKVIFSSFAPRNSVTPKVVTQENKSATSAPATMQVQTVAPTTTNRVSSVSSFTDQSATSALTAQSTASITADTTTSGGTAALTTQSASSSTPTDTGVLTWVKENPGRSATIALSAVAFGACIYMATRSSKSELNGLPSSRKAYKKKKKHKSTAVKTIKI
jgi:hypothetical protein